ncbi:MAG TPA: glutamate--tRNA ligase [Tessaracoccus flavescens]|uniref:Glutamate--tRNA ligase n=1 Tax=Tessaracoccus flavescens TaxID=399497 RepID=A0A921ELH6_9ACTN|nr:glutamate--tRNA ligase [Tessaracoccus flavescens]
MTELAPARTRVAPSPTGDPHVGTAFMALFDLAWARKTGGAFVLRIEDTDQNRLVEGSEQQIYDSLAWLGLQPDEGPHVGGEHGPYRQSERLDTYRPYVDQLIEAGHAYYCWCSSERLSELRKEQEAQKLSVTGYDRLCVGKTREERAALPGFSETPVVRMLIPDDVPLEFDDIVRGTVKAPRPDDQVILKADGFPTYHMAVVVDDHLMGINTVVRGEEWISSTPKHVLLYQWLGWELPQFAHMPLLRNTDKSKISKRKNPAARLMWFKEEGYLPEAVRNFLQLLGYAGDDENEVKSFDEFVDEFSWSKVNTVGPIFDLKKLDWLNGHYIRSLSAEELADRIIEFEQGKWSPTPQQVDVLRQAVPIIQERLVLLKDALPQLDYLFAESVTPEEDAVAALNDDAGAVLDAAIAVTESVAFDAESIQAGLRERIVEGMGIKPKFAFAPIRVAVSGRRVSPPLFESMEILGRDATLARLKALRASL